MCIQFLSANLVEGSLLTPSTVDAQYPVSNITDVRRTKCYRSTTNSDTIVIDLGANEQVDTFAIVDNWQNGFGVSTITLEGNGTDVWTAPAFSTTVTLDATFGVGVKAFTEQTLRFWRVVMTSTLGYCEIANIFLGKASKITTNGVGYNWQYRNRDLSKKSTNRYGQLFVDDIGTQKELNNLQFQIMDKDEMDVILNVFDANRVVKPFFVYFPLETDSLSNNDDRYNGMYYFSSEPVFTNVNSGYYNTALNLREAK